MDDFKVIYENDKEWGDYLICKHCGERVERGIVSVSHHWLCCMKRADGLIVATNDFERNILDSISINVKKNRDEKKNMDLSDI